MNPCQPWLLLLLLLPSVPRLSLNRFSFIHHHVENKWKKTGDGWKGWAENGPYDAIHVGAAAASIPIDLVSQLKVGGRMVVPVGPPSESQMLVQVHQ